MFWQKVPTTKFLVKTSLFILFFNRLTIVSQTWSRCTQRVSERCSRETFLAMFFESTFEAIYDLYLFWASYWSNWHLTKRLNNIHNKACSQRYLESQPQYGDKRLHWRNSCYSFVWWLIWFCGSQEDYHHWCSNSKFYVLKVCIS